ncbi:hypothetical protein ACJJTC_017306 [Scirpophaga incertulas]
MEENDDKLPSSSGTDIGPSKAKTYVQKFKTSWLENPDFKHWLKRSDKANTRWLSLQACVDRILEQHDALKLFFTEAVYEEVEDIIIQPPQTEPYSKLKNAIISRFSESYEEKVRRLLESEPIGDMVTESLPRSCGTSVLWLDLVSLNNC